MPRCCRCGAPPPGCHLQILRLLPAFARCTCSRGYVCRSIAVCTRRLLDSCCSIRGATCSIRCSGHCLCIGSDHSWLQRLFFWLLPPPLLLLLTSFHSCCLLCTLLCAALIFPCSRPSSRCCTCPCCHCLGFVDLLLPSLRSRGACSRLRVALALLLSPMLLLLLLCCRCQACCAHYCHSQRPLMVQQQCRRLPKQLPYGQPELLVHCLPLPRLALPQPVLPAGWL
mmetsp:Transcript_30329/g.77375  ORF Transcript_30329/g.77375 Transcript_30329/m.77375 type:complete len:226 (-) Transcript_30329:34-711(-)